MNGTGARVDGERSQDREDFFPEHAVELGLLVVLEGVILTNHDTRLGEIWAKLVLPNARDLGLKVEGGSE